MIFRYSIDNTGFNSNIDDEDIIAELLDDNQSFAERLKRLKNRGIVVNHQSETSEEISSDQNCPVNFNSQEVLDQLEKEAGAQNERVRNLSFPTFFKVKEFFETTGTELTNHSDYSRGIRNKSGSFGNVASISCKQVKLKILLLKINKNKNLNNS